MSLEIIRIARRAKRSGLVRTLKSIRKPFALWPLIAVMVKSARALVELGKNGTIKMDRLKRPIPVYTLILILLIGIAGGAYASSALIHGTLNTGSGAPDFSVSLAPPSLSLNPGSIATFTIQLSSLYGFSGSVNLNATPPATTSMTVIVNPNSVSLLTGTGNSTLTVWAPTSTPIATFIVNLTGSSAKLAHSVQAFLLVTSPPPPDYTVVANPISLTVSQGSSTTAGLTLASMSGFSGNVNLISTVGGGPSTSLNPTTVTLTSGGNSNSLLTVSTSGSTPRGGYTIFVLTTSGTLSHSLSISLTVK